MTHRTQPPRIKGLQWHDHKANTKAENALMGCGMFIAATALLLLALSFF